MRYLCIGILKPNGHPLYSVYKVTLLKVSGRNVLAGVFSKSFQRTKLKTRSGLEIIDIFLKV